MEFDQLCNALMQFVRHMEQLAADSLAAARLYLDSAYAAHAGAAAELERLQHFRGKPQGQQPSAEECSDLLAILNAPGRPRGIGSGYRRFANIVKQVEMRVLNARNAARHQTDAAAAGATLDVIFVCALEASRAMRVSKLLFARADSLLSFVEALKSEVLEGGDGIHRRVAWFVSSRTWFNNDHGKPSKV